MNHLFITSICEWQHIASTLIRCIVILTPGRPVMVRGPHFIISTMQAGTTPIFNVFGMTGPSTNRESNPQNLLVGARSPPIITFYDQQGLLRTYSVTRGLHQEPPPQIPTGFSTSINVLLSNAPKVIHL